MEPFIMVSYQWDVQPRVRKLHAKLVNAGYNVWTDYEKMEGGLIDSMAKAVAQADTVLICATTKYQLSRNCKLEAENACHLDRRIIPLIFDSNFKAQDPNTDWLGFIVRPKLYFRFETDDMLERNFTDLVKALGDSGRTAQNITETQPKSPLIFGRMKALQCSICLDRFKTPKALPCLHTFCASCLTGVAPRGTQSIACPICRKDAIVPEEDATQFPTNFTLQELIEEEAKTEQLFQKDSVFTCTCCDNKSPVEGKCATCNEYMCMDGVNAHKQLKVFRDHEVVFFDTKDIEPRVEATEPTPASNPQMELINAHWEIFDALYDEEHSIHLFSYWTKKSEGEKTWREAMVNYYSTCLEEGVFGDHEIIPRYRKVARVFEQAGQYSKALELVEKLLNDEEYKCIIKGSETKADLYYQGGGIYCEMLNSFNSMLEWDPELIKKQIDYARKALELRRGLSEESKHNQDDNSFAVGRILRLLGNALRCWWQKNDDNAAREEGRSVINESVAIFLKISAKGNAAKSLVNRGTLEDYGSEEQEKVFREAIKMAHEVYGESSTLCGGLYHNMNILYENRDNYYEAYNWLVKTQRIYEKIYGKDHPRTKRVHGTLATDPYDSIKEEKQAD